MAICGQCGKPIKEDAKFCGGCGAKRTVPPAAVEATADLEAAPTAALLCPTCGKPLAKPGASFCGSCGAKIEAPAAVAPPAPVRPPAPPVSAAPPSLPPSAPPAVHTPQAAKLAGPDPRPAQPAAPAPPGPAAATPGTPPAPGPKKKGSPVLMILAVVALVGCVLLAAAGVGGYFLWKKAKDKAAAKLAEVTQQVDEQLQEAQAQGTEPQPERSSETPSEPTPNAAETAAAPQEEMAQSTAEPEPPSANPPRASSPPSLPNTKPAPAPSRVAASPSDPTQDVAPDQVKEENLDKPLLPPPVTSPSLAPVQTATLGLILESQAPGTKMVVKVDGTKIYEQDMPATKAATRIAKELSVAAGPRHIRVAVWRPPQPPVTGEWDFTFEPGSHPVFRLDLGADWKMEVKRFQ